MAGLRICLPAAETKLREIGKEKEDAGDLVLEFCYKEKARVGGPAKICVTELIQGRAHLQLDFSKWNGRVHARVRQWRRRGG